MKKVLLLSALATALLFLSCLSFAQVPQFPFRNVWSPVATYSQIGSQGPVSFVIGNKAYAGSGAFTNEFWEYDPSLNTWTRKADIPGEARLRAVGTKETAFLQQAFCFYSYMMLGIHRI